jgi:type IV pilus assembly protein PilY1
LKSVRVVKSHYEATMSIFRSPPGRRAIAVPLLVAGVVLASADRAEAQSAGVTKTALPNVMLLVDTSGSMERMFDGSKPSANTTAGNACSPGTSSNPNRWGSLVQAMTGNMQPFFSCDAMARDGKPFKNEYGIDTGSGMKLPQDADYALPYHRPLTGSTTDACALAPTKLPGVASWGNSRTGGGGNPGDFPSDALTGRKYSSLKTAYDAVLGSGALTATTCTFEQAKDGQLDAARDYVRFGLMTFDNEIDDGLGVTSLASGPLLSNPFLGTWSYVASTGLAKGNPFDCSTKQTWEVGARHYAAPPWEGRHVRLPAWDASLLDVQRTNEQVQQVLIGTRPYGATPIDGMLVDAYDYLVKASDGPTLTDQYVKNGCRQQFVVLLTDGAPNLNMRPSCETTTGSNPGTCPFAKAVTTAKALYDGGIPVYVIGFSVNGENTATDGFPTGTANYVPTTTARRNCRDWIKDFGSGSTFCKGADRPAAGTTAEACCVLNEIAYAGSDSTNPVPAYFAESQADLVLAFGRVVGGITRDASTRTVPATSAAVNFTDATTGTQIRSGQFVASFIPSAQRVWSGEIDRQRTYCVDATPTPQAQSVAEGDSFAANLALQSGSKNRLIFTALPTDASKYDSAGTLRPYKTTGASDGVTTWAATESVEPPGGATLLSATTDFAKMLGIDDKTCKRVRITKDSTAGGVEVYPPLGAADCADVAWAFATARAAKVEKTVAGVTKDYNIRCSGTAAAANANTGRCSISGTACGLTGATSGACGKGEVCVPLCAALGAVFRSNPAVVGPPDGLIRDDGYRAFAQARSLRRPTLYVATTDGILHAFKALADTKISAKEGANFELWGFVPPAVLPNLAANFPTGQQILLDGAPVVRDVVWDRKAADATDVKQWKTSLVASLGFGGGGYYHLNVTDADCGGLGNEDACLSTSAGFKAATSADEAANLGSATKPGPHFTWQLTDLPCATTACGTGDDTGVRGRKDPDGKQRIALFGVQTATPAVTVVQAEVGTGADKAVRQVGVAILPGGIGDAPSATGACKRAVSGGVAGYAVATYVLADTYRENVRQWGASCSAKVAGRSLTVVRLDTGEILRHFSRAEEAPGVLSAVTTKTAFDSPVTGTPVVYPNVLGAPAQKAYVGDADGTVWRLDLTSTNPADWSVRLFHDAIQVASGASTLVQAAASQPIVVPLVLSTSAAGDPVIHAATGDQENIVADDTLKNFVSSVTDNVKLGKPSVNWTLTLEKAERVTGPMAVFDRTLYFASYAPTVPESGKCNQPGTPSLWGMDYVVPEGTSGNASGGEKRWCKTDATSGASNVSATSGVCSGTIDQKQAVKDVYSMIPGVSLQQTLACSTQTGTDPAYSGFSSTEYRLVFGLTTSGSGNASGAVTQAGRQALRIARPRSPARIDAWAFVTD